MCKYNNLLVKEKINNNIEINKLEKNEPYIKRGNHENQVVVNTSFEKRASLSTHFYDPNLIELVQEYFNPINDNIKKQKLLFLILDKYLVNFLEEMTEFSSAYRYLKESETSEIQFSNTETAFTSINNKSNLKITKDINNKDQVLDELCDLIIYADIIGYILTTCLDEYTLNDYNVLIPDLNEISFESEMLKINENIIKLRRLFSVRKWHKPHVEVDDFESLLIDNFIMFYTHLVQVTTCMSILFYNEAFGDPNMEYDYSFITKFISKVESKRSLIKDSILNK